MSAGATIGSPETGRSPESQRTPSVTFEGDSLVDLEVWLNECRVTSRRGTDYYILVDTHNKIREALGMDPKPVHPDFQEAYERYRAELAEETQS